jgi:hypothetical protein
MVRPFLVALAAGVVIQGGVMAVRYDDLLYLRQPVARMMHDDRATFTRHASRALERTSLTRRHLESIADVAQSFGDHTLEVQATERRLTLDPDDVWVRLRYADTLRRAGNFPAAEREFLIVLQHAEGRQR